MGLILNRSATVAIFAIILQGCGGGDSNSSTPSSSIAPPEQCSVTGQKQLFLDYLRDDYFWAEDLPSDVNIDDYSDIFNMLAALRVPQDRFSFLLTNAEYQARYVDASFAGFGFSNQITATNRALIRYVYADSPAEQAGLRRGDELIAINGEAVTTLIANDQFNAALGPAEPGIAVELTWQRPNQEQITAIVTKENVATNTVFAPQVIQTDAANIGYLVLDSFINRTGDDLNQAFDELSVAGIDELIIDVRYNGGGLIRYANQLASQAAGNNVLGNVFINYEFNNNNAGSNSTELFQLGEGVAQFDLDRVFVLTTGASCSSSELIINSLEPFIEVVVIGEPTCGKPVGQIISQICDKRTFVVNFQTTNALGQADYFNGIQPTCTVAEAIVGDWGDPADPLLQSALAYLDAGVCPLASRVQSALNLSSSSSNPNARETLISPQQKWRTEY